MTGRYEGLTPAERLELERLDAEADAERRRLAASERFWSVEWPVLRAELEAWEAGTPPATSGPEPTRAAIEKARADLKADGKPSGYKSIAKAIGYSESTVRRRLGKR